QIEAGPARAELAQARSEKADGEDADDAVEKPDDLPDPVALVDIELPLGEAEQSAHLGAAVADDHEPTSSSSSSASRVLPVRCIKTSSSVAPPWRTHSSPGLPSARTRPPSIIKTRSQRAEASSMSCVQSSTVISRPSRSASSAACTSFFERGSSP